MCIYKYCVEKNERNKYNIVLRVMVVIQNILTEMSGVIVHVIASFDFIILMHNYERIYGTIDNFDSGL